MDSQDMDLTENAPAPPPPPPPLPVIAPAPASKKKARSGSEPASQKRRCVSIACVACRKRKSKCDGGLPRCAACASVYGTDCAYDPTSDHRRKGVYRDRTDNLKADNATLQTLLSAILNANDEDVPEIVRTIRGSESLELAAQQITRQRGVEDTRAGAVAVAEAEAAGAGAGRGAGAVAVAVAEPASDEFPDPASAAAAPPEGEWDLARKMGELRLENGSVRFIGGTSHLIYLGESIDEAGADPQPEYEPDGEDPVASWTGVTKDAKLVVHLMNMYFTWHYPYFTTLSKSLFYKDFLAGRASLNRKTAVYCTPLLVNAMLALGCHFSDREGAFAVPGDSRSKGNHFFDEAKRLVRANDEFERPRLTTVQALALMSVREAGCGREAKGWAWSGMAIRGALDTGLNLDLTGTELGGTNKMSEHEVDARRVTFWGCFLFDKAWSNYLGRLPQIHPGSYSVPKYDVFPDEDAELWSPYTDNGFGADIQLPSRTRTIGLQLMKLCEISADLLHFFYHPHHFSRPRGRSAELKKLSELQRRLEDWREDLPKEFEATESQLPNVLLMHMFLHLQYIHLFRPFLRYSPEASPLPAHVSPRSICTTNARAISRLMRMYKKAWGMRQICNVAVYMIHNACTIHLLNLPHHIAHRDLNHGVRHLEEIAEDWLCARRTLSIIGILSQKWGCELPEEAAAVLRRTAEKYGSPSTPSRDQPATPSPPPDSGPAVPVPPAAAPKQQQPRVGDRGPNASPSSHTISPSLPLTPSSVGHDTQGTPWASPTVLAATATYAPTVPAFPPASGLRALPPQMPLQPIPVTASLQPPLQQRPQQAHASADQGHNWFWNDRFKDWQQGFGPWDAAVLQQDPTTGVGAGAGADSQVVSDPTAATADRIFLYEDEVTGIAGSSHELYLNSFGGVPWGGL